MLLISLSTPWAQLCDQMSMLESLDLWPQKDPGSYLILVNLARVHSPVSAQMAKIKAEWRHKITTPCSTLSGSFKTTREAWTRPWAAPVIRPMQQSLADMCPIQALSYKCCLISVFEWETGGSNMSWQLVRVIESWFFEWVIQYRIIY